MKKIVLFIVITFVVQACCVCNKMNSVEMMEFDRIIFHSSTCFGSCPQLSIEVNRDGSTKLKRQFFTDKVEPINGRSGEFKGHISKTSLDELMLELSHSNYETLSFPNVDCCDAPIITIIIYAKGKRVYLHSMLPSKEAADLIKYLTQLATDVELPKATEKLEFEN